MPSIHVNVKKLSDFVLTYNRPMCDNCGYPAHEIISLDNEVGWAIISAYACEECRPGLMVQIKNKIASFLVELRAK